jgi:cell division septation protein DedD
MEIDVTAHIQRLLFNHPALNIPGLGGFATVITPAQVDFGGTQMQPPGRMVSFSEQTMVEDDLLVNAIALEAEISTDESRVIVADFVEKTMNLLNQREIVTLPGLGRLYKNYERKIQFLPDSNNFSKDTFLLPNLSVSPLNRAGEATFTPATEIQAASAPETSAPNQTPPRKSSPLVAVGLIVLIGVLGYLAWQITRSTPNLLALDREQQENTARTNVAPPASEFSEKPSADLEKEPNTEVEPPAQPSPPQSTLPTPQPQQKESQKNATTQREAIPLINTQARNCILVVATLSDADNATLLTEKLKEAGYQIYQYHAKGIQVGISFPYKDIVEVQQKIIALQQLTGLNEIWIKQR